MKLEGRLLLKRCGLSGRRRNPMSKASALPRCQTLTGGRQNMVMRCRRRASIHERRAPKAIQAEKTCRMGVTRELR